MTPFRLGLVGAGRMGRTHLRALTNSDVVRVVAVAEPDDAARALLNGSYGKIYADLASMIQAGGLDGVLVAVPTPLHLIAIEQLADAGLPILCEKPCGITSEQARHAVDIIARHKVKLQIAYWRRFVPALQDLRRRILLGEFGDLYFLAHYQWDGVPPSPAFRASSGGIFIDMGVHEFDQIRWLSGQNFDGITSMAADIGAAPAVAGDAESAQALCRLSGGSTALVSLGRRHPLGDVCRVELFGTRGAVDCRFLWPPDADAVFLHALRRQAEGFAAWVRGGPSSGATAADAVAALQAAELASTIFNH